MLCVGGWGEPRAGGGLTLLSSSVVAVGVGVAMSPGLSGCSQLVPICGQWELSSQCIPSEPQLSLRLLEACTGMRGGKAQRAHCRRGCKKKTLPERGVKKCGESRGNEACQLTSLSWVEP